MCRALRDALVLKPLSPRGQNPGLWSGTAARGADPDAAGGGAWLRHDQMDHDSEIINDCGSDSRVRLWVGTIHFHRQRYTPVIASSDYQMTCTKIKPYPTCGQECLMESGGRPMGELFMSSTVGKKGLGRFDYDPELGVPAKE